MTDKILFQNKRYTVTVGTGAMFGSEVEYATYYDVTNVDTGVVELKTPGLIDAIFFAENSDRALDSKPWEWARQTEMLVEAAASGPAN